MSTPFASTSSPASFFSCINFFPAAHICRRKTKKGETTINFAARRPVQPPSLRTQSDKILDGLEDQRK